MLLLHYILLLYIIKNCLCDILFCVMVYLFLLVSCFSPFLTPTPSAAPQRHGGTGPSAADDAGRGGQLSRRHPPPGAAAGGGQGIAKAGGHPPPRWSSRETQTRFSFAFLPCCIFFLFWQHSRFGAVFFCVKNRCYFRFLFFCVEFFLRLCGVWGFFISATFTFLGGFFCLFNCSNLC